MARCVNCLRTCTGPCCSLECANERMAVMLEGVKLLDALMAMVDEAAEKRGTAGAARAAVASGALATPPKRSAKPAPAAADGTMLLLEMPAQTSHYATDGGGAG